MCPAKPPPLPKTVGSPKVPAATKERRQHPRVQVSVHVDFSSSHNFYCGKTRDISTGGLFIESSVCPPVGSRITIDLQLLKNRLRAEAEVVWLLLDPGGDACGMGVRFVDLPRATRKKIEAFMRLRRAVFFDMDLEDVPADEEET